MLTIAGGIVLGVAGIFCAKVLINVICVICGKEVWFVE